MVTGTEKPTEIFADRQVAFLPYVCCGDPNESFTLKLVDTLISCGANGIEIGIPFSDPVADGKTISGATERALKAGMTPDKAFSAVRQIRKKHPRIIILIMTYYNIVFSHAKGMDGFANEAKVAGANGLIIPDVPLEESDEIQRACKENNIALIRFVTPNMNDERLALVLKRADGFVYVVAAYGTTGVREEISIEAIKLIERIRKRSNVPLMVGFGIQNPEHITRYLEAGANGLIMGSAIIDAYMHGFEKGDNPLDGSEKETNALGKVTNLIKRVREAIV